MRYKRRNKKVIAIQYLREDNISKIIDWIEKYKLHGKLIYNIRNNEYYIKTSDGDIMLHKGDYIIRYGRKQIGKCNPVIFNAIYKKTK